MKFFLNTSNIISDKPIPNLIEESDLSQYAENAFKEVKNQSQNVFNYCIFYIEELKEILEHPDAEFISFLFSNYLDSQGRQISRTIIAIGLDKNGDYIGTPSKSFYSTETPKFLGSNASFKRSEVLLIPDSDTIWYWPNDFDPNSTMADFFNWSKNLKVEEAIRAYREIIIDEQGSTDIPQRVEAFFPVDWLKNQYFILKQIRIALIPIILYAKKTFNSGDEVTGNFVTFSILPVNQFNELEKFRNPNKIEISDIPTSGIAYPPRWNPKGIQYGTATNPQ